MLSLLLRRSVKVLQLNFRLDRHFIMLIVCLRVCVSCSVCDLYLCLLLKWRPSIFSVVTFLISLLQVLRVQLQLCFLQTCMFAFRGRKHGSRVVGLILNRMGTRSILMFFLFFSVIIRLKSNLSLCLGVG